MSVYWDLIKQGLTRQEIKDSHTPERLIAIGFYYSQSERAKDLGIAQGTAFKRYGEHIPCYDEGVVLEYLRDFAMRGSRFPTPEEFIAHLNESEVYTKTGKCWNSGTFKQCFTNKMIRNGNHFPTRRKKRKKEQVVKKFHTKVNEVFRLAVSESEICNISQMTKEFDRRGFTTRMGNAWSRESLTLIIRGNPDLDWTFFDIELKRQEERELLYESKREIIESVNWREVCSLNEVQSILDLPRNNWLVQDVYKNLCVHWTETSKFIAYLKRVVAICDSRIRDVGYQSYDDLADHLNNLGLETNIYTHNSPHSGSGIWHASTIQRLLEIHADFDKDKFYTSLVNDGIRDFLMSYEGNNVLTDLCSHLNEKSLYPIMAWGNGSFFRHKDWDILTIKRCIDLGVFPCLG